MHTLAKRSAKRAVRVFRPLTSRTSVSWRWPTPAWMPSIWDAG
jgi:hypothetical protein